MQEALTNFMEQWHGTCRHQFLVLHAEDTCPVSVAVTHPDESAQLNPASKSGKVYLYGYHSKINASKIIIIHDSVAYVHLLST